MPSVLAAGLTLGLSEVVLWLSAGAEMKIADAVVLFIAVTLIGVVGVSIVIGLMAIEHRQLRPWKELELSSE